MDEKKDGGMNGCMNVRVDGYRGGCMGEMGFCCGDEIPDKAA